MLHCSTGRTPSHEVSTGSWTALDCGTFTSHSQFDHFSDTGSGERVALEFENNGDKGSARRRSLVARADTSERHAMKSPVAIRSKVLEHWETKERERKLQGEMIAAHGGRRKRIGCAAQRSLRDVLVLFSRVAIT